MQGGIDECRLLGVVNLGNARGRGRGRSTARIQHLTAPPERLLEAMTDLVPRTLILRLFLTPHHFAGVGI